MAFCPNSKVWGSLVKKNVAIAACKGGPRGRMFACLSGAPFMGAFMDADLDG